MKTTIVTTSFLAAFFIISCGKNPEAAETDQPFVLSDTMAKMITLGDVKQSTVQDQLSLSGEVSFDENSVVKIFSNSSGQVQKTNVSLGDKVAAGQVLAVIKSADVAGNYSDLSSTNADLAIAKRQMTNQEALYKAGIASQKEYEEAREDHNKALAAQSKVQSLININGGGNTQAGGLYYIKAPISGYIVEKKVNAGSFIRQDAADNMFTISSLKDVWIWANVYEADIAKVKTGYSATITTAAYPDRKFYGTINQVSQVLDLESKAMRVKVQLPNTEMLLKPQMFTKVTIDNQDSTTALTVPAAALIPQGPKNYVVVYKSTTDLDIAEVNVIKTLGNLAYVTGNVQPGQKVITNHQNLIFNQLVSQ